MPKSNISDAFAVQRDMLKKSGVWPEEHSSILYNIKFVISWILAVALCTTMWMEVISDITDFAKLSEIFFVTITITVYIVKLFCLTYYRKTFINTINLLTLPIFTSYPADADHFMAKTIKIVVFLANTYRYLCLCCIILYAVYPFLDNKPLPFPFPYDTGKYTNLMYVFQIVSVSLASWNTSTMDTLQVSLLSIAAAQLDILAAKIGILLDNNVDSDKYRIFEGPNGQLTKKLRQCVEHHLVIMKFIESLEKIFRLATFSQFIGSTLIICNTLFYFLLIPQASSMFFLLTDYVIIMLVELFMFCWFGNEIIVKSLKVADACYLTKWYVHGGTVRQYLFIIMERSRRPLAVTVFSVANLSLNSFKSIMQWSYSCFALLLKLYYSQGY